LRRLFARVYPNDMLKIIYTNHSLQRLDERGISRGQVEAAIREGVRYDGEGGLRKAVYRNEKGVIIVVYTIKSVAEIVIITAY
jgi:hypothetical protein